MTGRRGSVLFGVPVCSPSFSTPPTVSPTRSKFGMPSSASRYVIEISNEQRVLRVNRPRLIRIAESALAAEKVRSAEISVALVDDVRIHEINREYLQHDYPTDVISFLLEEEPPRPTAGQRQAGSRRKAGPASPRGAGKSLGGEIIISTETAVKMATDYGWSPQQELSLYLVHGLLHLCGYDDLTPVEQQLMRAREVEVLQPWKIVPRYAV
jgi:probable rRNA maturation factor